MMMLDITKEREGVKNLEKSDYVIIIIIKSD